MSEASQQQIDSQIEWLVENRHRLEPKYKAEVEGALRALKGHMSTDEVDEHFNERWEEIEERHAKEMDEIEARHEKESEAFQDERDSAENTALWMDEADDYESPKEDLEAYLDSGSETEEEEEEEVDDE